MPVGKREDCHGFCCKHRHGRSHRIIRREDHRSFNQLWPEGLNRGCSVDQFDIFGSRIFGGQNRSCAPEDPIPKRADIPKIVICDILRDDLQTVKPERKVARRFEQFYVRGSSRAYGIDQIERR